MVPCVDFVVVGFIGRKVVGVFTGRKVVVVLRVVVVVLLVVTLRLLTSNVSMGIKFNFSQYSSNFT